MSRQAAGEDVINLAWGEPHFETPHPIRKSLLEAVEAGHTNYTESAGIRPLRDRIAQKLSEENDLPTDPQEVIVTPGAKQAVFLAIRTILDPGDEILIPEPAWTSYGKMVKIAGGVPISIPGDPDNRFLPSVSDIRAAGSSSVKGIIINTPVNPTGAVWSRDELHEVGEIARDRDLYIIADEVYEHYTFGSREHVSIGSIGDLSNRTVTINGLSKSHAMTGWRLGYLSAKPSFRSNALTVHQHLNTCATSFVQQAAIAAFDSLAHLPPVVEEYEQNYKIFARDSPIPVNPAEGAFYCLLDVRDYDSSSSAIARNILSDVGVAFTPGGTYGDCCSGFLRASLAAPTATIRRAVDRLAEWNRDD